MPRNVTLHKCQSNFTEELDMRPASQLLLKPNVCTIVHQEQCSSDDEFTAFDQPSNLNDN